MDRARLNALLEQVFSHGGTIRDLLVAFSEMAGFVVAGPVFRAALDQYGLRAAFDAVFQDPAVLEQLEMARASVDRRAIELFLNQPLNIMQRIGFTRSWLQVNRELVLLVDDRGEVELRRGDMKLRWLGMREDVLVRLRPTRYGGTARDVLFVSAGHVLNQTTPLDVITLMPHLRPTAQPSLVTPPDLIPTTMPDVSLTVLHHTPGRVRFRVDSLYRNHSEKQRLERVLRGRAGIIGVVANVLTGSLLIFFEPVASLEEIEQIVRRALAGFESDIGQRAQLQHPWHLLDIDQTVSLLESSPVNGLSDAIAQQRLREYGPNLLPQAAVRSPLQILLEQFASLPVALLGVSAVVSAFTGGLVDGIVILGVVALNAGIGYVTESWAERTIAGLNRGSQPHAIVVRDGREFEVPGAQVVPGDLIVLRRGLAVPADARLIVADHLSVDESALTGESMPVSKSIARLSDPNTPLGSRTNMVYRGSVVTGGSGLAIVVATGLSTEVGEIQRLLGEARQPETPLQQQLGALSRQLVLASLAICGGVFVIGLLRGQALVPMLKTVIALAVAAVPEGLPTVATTTLAIGLRRLEQQGVLVRRLAAVETLGALDYLCLDKTGTITRNEMTLLAAYTGSSRYEHNDTGFSLASEPINLMAHPDLDIMMRLVSLCSEVELVIDGAELRLIGSPTELALVRAAQTNGIDVVRLRASYPLLRTRLRSEGRGFMDTLHQDGDGVLLAVKGSPDQVLGLCNRFLEHGQERPLSPADRARIALENERMASQALRVLGVAFRRGDCVPDQSRDLIWVGMVGIADPPRAELPTLVAELRSAGIRLVMITGDQSATAMAVARQIGLSRNGQLESLDAANLEALPPDVVRSLAERVDIFSRVSPAHKLRIVQALQRAGHVVAMTGDGINDGPALRAANIGIAMGASGSEVAQEVADVVVRDDNLATLVGAIEQGRTIYIDIKKAVHFILASNTSEIMLTLAATVLALGEPLTPLQLLWINLVTDVFPELALGLEPPERDVLAQPPRDPQAAMFDRRDIQRIGVEGAILTACALGAYGWGLTRYGPGARAGSLAFTTLTSAQLLYALSCRSEQHWFLERNAMRPNPYMALAVGGGLGLQSAAMLLPGLRQLLGAVPLGIADWLIAAVLATAPFLASEFLKAATYRQAVPQREEQTYAR